MWESDAVRAKGVCGTRWRGNAMSMTISQTISDRTSKVGKHTALRRSYVRWRNIAGPGGADVFRHVGTPIDGFNRCIVVRTAPLVKIIIKLPMECVPSFPTSGGWCASTHRTEARMPSLMQLANGLTAGRRRHSGAIILATLRRRTGIAGTGCCQVGFLDALHWSRGRGIVGVNPARL